MNQDNPFLQSSAKIAQLREQAAHLGRQASMKTTPKLHGRIYQNDLKTNIINGKIRSSILKIVRAVLILSLLSVIYGFYLEFSIGMPKYNVVTKQYNLINAWLGYSLANVVGLFSAICAMTRTFEKLLGYESACKDGDGTSIRILFENGSILFDSALPDKIILKESDKIVFFSHSHADHTGGILKILNSMFVL